MSFEVDRELIPIAAMFIPIVGTIALFSFLGVASWSEARRKERVSYYTNEALKKIAESSGESAKSALEYLRERQRESNRRRMEGMKLGGLITSAVGIGLILLLRGIAHEEPVYLVGTIPLLVGVAMLLYCFVLAPKEETGS